MNQLPTLHDPLAVAVAIQASFVETQLGRVQVGTASPMLYGLAPFTPGRQITKGWPDAEHIGRARCRRRTIPHDVHGSGHLGRDIRQAGMLRRLQ